MAQAETANAFSLLFIFDVIRKYLTYIVAVVGIACILAMVFTMSFFYPPEYEASTIIYPNSAERLDLDNIFNKEPDLYVYGSAKEAEKLVNVAGARQLKLEVIDSLDLWSVYDVEKDNPDAYPIHYVLRNFDGYVSASRVSGDGVEIVAYDVDPQRAADIVNLMAYKIDEHNRRMVNRNKASLLRIYQKGAEDLERRIDLLGDSVRNVRRRYNIFRSLTQTEVMVEQVLIAEGDLAEARGRAIALENQIGKNNPKTQEAWNEVAALKSRVRSLTTDATGSAINLERFREGVDQVMSMEEQLETMAEELAYTKRKIEYHLTMDNTPFSTVMMPDPAIPTDKKARPVRWLILVVTFLIATVASILGAVLVDFITRPKEELA